MPVPGKIGSIGGFIRPFIEILLVPVATRWRLTMGMLYQRGKTWWIKYYRNGKSIRESAKTTSKMVAEKILKRREAEIAYPRPQVFIYQNT